MKYKSIQNEITKGKLIVSVTVVPGFQPPFSEVPKNPPL